MGAGLRLEGPVSVDAGPLANDAIHLKFDQLAKDQTPRATGAKQDWFWFSV